MRQTRGATLVMQDGTADRRSLHDDIDALEAMLSAMWSERLERAKDKAARRM